VGAHGQLNQIPIGLSPETKVNVQKKYFDVTVIAFTMAIIGNKLLEFSVLFLVGNPGTLDRTHINLKWSLHLVHSSNYSQLYYKQ